MAMIRRWPADRMRPDLCWRPTGGLDHGLHGVDVFLDAAGWRLPVNIDEHVVGVVAGERPCQSAPFHAVKSRSSMLFRLRVTSSSAMSTLLRAPLVRPA